MHPGPGLVIKGAIIGCLVVASLCYYVSAGAAPLPTSPNTPVQSNTNGQLFPDGQMSQDQALITTSLNAFGNNKDDTKNKSAKQKKTNNKSNNCRVSDRFPESILQWCNLITSYANLRNLPADLVAAVMLQESGGDSKAYSTSGAVGLLQVMPRDGIATKFTCGDHPCFVNRPSIEELQDPEFNIEYGTGMLATLVDKTGSVRDALKSYGPIGMGYYYADKVLSIYENYKQ